VNITTETRIEDLVSTAAKLQVTALRSSIPSSIVQCGCKLCIDVNCFPL
jgi:hypothetical protein